jgi:hypothetical protein
LKKSFKALPAKTNSSETSPRKTYRQKQGLLGDEGESFGVVQEHKKRCQVDGNVTTKSHTTSTRGFWKRIMRLRNEGVEVNHK